MNIDRKVFNNTFKEQIEQYMETVLHHDQAGFIPGM